MHYRQPHPPWHTQAPSACQLSHHSGSQTRRCRPCKRVTHSKQCICRQHMANIWRPQHASHTHPNFHGNHRIHPEHNRISTNTCVGIWTADTRPCQCWRILAASSPHLKMGQRLSSKSLASSSTTGTSTISSICGHTTSVHHQPVSTGGLYCENYRVPNTSVQRQHHRQGT
jgi:hypothetical protein